MKKWPISWFSSKPNTDLHENIKEQEASTSLPEHVIPDSKPIRQSTDTLVANLAEQLRYVHPKQEFMAAKREEAYEALAKLGSGASPAIPDLIRKLFDHNSLERIRAGQTLDQIDKEWPANESAAVLIPYLIGKLDKAGWESTKAAEILARVGQSIHSALLETFNSNEHLDSGLQAKALGLLCKTGADANTVYPIVLDLLINSPSNILLEAAMKAITYFGVKDDVLSAKLVGFLEHKDENLRARTLDALQTTTENIEPIIPGLVKCLADHSDRVREKSIAWLSKIDTGLWEGILTGIVLKKGEMTESELKKLFDKLDFWLGDSIVEGYQRNFRETLNNLSWYGLELNNEFKKKDQLVESSLQVLTNRGYADTSLIKPVMELYGLVKSPAIQVHCIRFLGCVKVDNGEVLPFVLNCLKNPAESVRNTIISTLNQIDPDWIRRPEIQPVLVNLIEALDGNQRTEARQALMSMGSISAPALTAYLEQTNDWALHHAIVDILNNLEDSSGISITTLRRVLQSLENTKTRNAITGLIKKLEENN